MPELEDHLIASNSGKHAECHSPSFMNLYVVSTNSVGRGRCDPVRSGEDLKCGNFKGGRSTVL